MPISATQNDSRTDGNHAWVLFMLLLVYTLNIVDRQIIGILAVPIKADLARETRFWLLSAGAPYSPMMG
jgi:hypothetical protein